jgi:ABC-type sulfate/molybdate transport systems ATPase subunit
VLLSGFGDRALTACHRDHVGFLFQFCNLMPSLTARENVALASEGAPKPMSPDAALALVDLADRIVRLADGRMVEALTNHDTWRRANENCSKRRDPRPGRHWPG